MLDEIKDRQLNPDCRIYTDGSVRSGRRGGWAFIIKFRRAEIVDSGHIRSGNINLLELEAAINALLAVPGRNQRVWLYTDSDFLVNCQHRNHAKWFTPAVLRFKKLCELHTVVIFLLQNKGQVEEHRRVHYLARRATQEVSDCV